MISAFNHRLLLIEQALSNNGAVLARLPLLQLGVGDDCAASSPSICDDDDESAELSRLRDWVVSLRAQLARTERRLERLRAGVARHDAQLDDIRTRIVWSSGGCAVVRPQTAWDAHPDGKSGARAAATGRGTASAWPPPALQTRPHLSRSSRPSHVTSSGRSHSAREVVDCGGVAPQLSRSFTSLLPVKRPQQSGVCISNQATTSSEEASNSSR